MNRKTNNRLIQKHKKGNIVYRYHGAYSPKDLAYVLPRYVGQDSETTIGLPEIEITPGHNTDLSTAMQGRGDLGKTALEYVTPVGDVEDVYNIGNDLYLGNYGKAALGAGLFFLPDVIGKPLKRFIKTGRAYANVIPAIYNKGKHFTGVNKTKRTANALFSVGKSPKYVNALNDHPDLINQIDLWGFPKYTPNLVDKFGIVWGEESAKGSFYPKSESIKYLNPESSEKEVIQGFDLARKTLRVMDISDRYALRLKYSFNKMYEELSKDPVYKSIIDESPLYIEDVYNFYKHGNLPKEEFVKNLINKANSYRRFMREPHTSEEFLTLNGMGGGRIDVEGAKRSDFNFEYGSYPAYFQGKPTLEGPVETWWSQRIPKGITVTPGMHSTSKFFNRLFKKYNGSFYREDTLDLNKRFNKSTEGLPENFIHIPVHQVFTGPAGSKLPNFKVTLNEMPDDFTWGLGYKHGGKIYKE